MLLFELRTTRTGAVIQRKLRERRRPQLTVVKRSEVYRGFKLLPRRWVVERTFTWLGRYRRLSQDYERCSRRSEAMVYLASIRRLLDRLAPSFSDTF